MAQVDSSLAKWFGKTIRVNVDTTKGSDEDFRTFEGKVITASEVGLCIRARGGPVIIESKSIIGEIEEVKRAPRRRVVIRYVREINSDEESARQHLADRHGQPVSILNHVVEEAVLRRMHDNIPHDDLGHRHGQRPGGGPRLAELEDSEDD